MRPAADRIGGGAPHLRTSMTRIWGPAPALYDVRDLPVSDWRFGDYVLAEVRNVPRGRGVEIESGRRIQPLEGQLLVCALGSRFATLELTGSWRDVSGDGRMELLTGVLPEASGDGEPG